MDKPLKSMTHGQCDLRPFQTAGHHRPTVEYGSVNTMCMFYHIAWVLNYAAVATNHSMDSLSARSRQLNKYHFRRRSSMSLRLGGGAREAVGFCRGTRGRRRGEAAKTRVAGGSLDERRLLSHDNAIRPYCSEPGIKDVCSPVFAPPRDTCLPENHHQGHMFPALNRNRKRISNLKS